MKQLGLGRGMALISTLLFSTLLVVMVSGLFLVTRGKLWLSRAYHDQVAALYLAELAIQDAMVSLEADPTWTAGFNTKRLPGVPGEYTISFNTGSGAFTSLESINNHDGQHDDSFRGDDTVPRGHALIIASARVGNSLRVVEALVHIGGGLYDTDVPLLNDGIVALRGEVTVDGVKAIGDGTPVPGGIHSNLPLPDNDLVTLVGTDPLISGKVSSSGSSAGAVNLGGYTPDLGVQTSAPQMSMEDIDILSQISARASAPIPAVAPIGTTTLSGGPDYYYAGDLVLNGDLKLEGVNLHVNGNLTVNGSITGEGSVYVAQKTSFKGSAEVTTADPQRIALYSHGSVELSGFDGTAFIDSVAASDPDAAGHWAAVKAHLGEYQTLVYTDPLDLGQDSRIDYLGNWLAGGAAGIGPEDNRLGKLKLAVESQPSSSAQEFISKKLGHLESTFFAMMNGRPEEDAALQYAENGYLVHGSIDSIIDNDRDDLVPLIQNYVNSIDYDHVGSAYFQGLVYTHGYIHASHEVTVVGALVAHQSGTGPPVPSEVVGGQTLNPGDVYLLDGTRVIYVEEFFKPNLSSGGPSAGGCRIVTWMGR